MRRKDTHTPDMFDMLPSVQEPLSEKLQEECKHAKEVKTETEWPNFPGDPRMTWTCVDCGHRRGRC